jgi:hypothetical protein
MTPLQASHQKERLSCILGARQKNLKKAFAAPFAAKAQHPLEEKH